MKFLKPSIAFILAAVLITGCRKRDAAELSDNLVYFEYSSQGIEEATNSFTVKLKLVRPVDKDIPVVLNLTETGLAYGTDYTTTPAATGGKLSLTLPSGNNEASFTISKVPGALFDGDEKLVFDLYSSGAPVFIGNPKQLEITFKELVAASASMTINGGGPTYPNKVFIDLSANRQTPVMRTNWDLGFYTDPSDFKVILNASTAMMAKQIAKNDLTQVTAADTVGFSTDVAYSAFTPTAGQLVYVDYPSGDLTKTAFGLISATATDNKVYIINCGTGVGSPAPARGWKKVRVLRNASGGYTLQYADIASATFSTIDIPKDSKFFYKYISFDNGAVAVEPEKEKWDIAWTYSGYTTNFGGEVPYLFQDMVFQNRNVQVAKVLTSTKPYDNFVEADIASVTFSSVLSTIGSDWRTTQPLGVKDQYYIIRDASNNYYKVKFTDIADAGVRGYPKIQFKLVKRG